MGECEVESGGEKEKGREGGGGGCQVGVVERGEILLVVGVGLWGRKV